MQKNVVESLFAIFKQEASRDIEKGRRFFFFVYKICLWKH